MIMNIKIGDESGDSAEGGTLNDCEEEVEVLALTERILIGLGEFFIVFGGTGPDAIFDCFMNVIFDAYGNVDGWIMTLSIQMLFSSFVCTV